MQNPVAACGGDVYMCAFSHIRGFHHNHKGIHSPKRLTVSDIDLRVYEAFSQLLTSLILTTLEQSWH